MASSRPLGTPQSPISSGLREDDDYRAVGLRERLYDENATCQYCQDLNCSYFEIPAGLLWKSSRSGCPPCRLVYQSVDPGDLEDERLTLLYVEVSYRRPLPERRLEITHVFDAGSQAKARSMCLTEGRKPCREIISVSDYWDRLADLAGNLDFQIGRLIGQGTDERNTVVREIEIYTLASTSSQTDSWSI